MDPAEIDATCRRRLIDLTTTTHSARSRLRPGRATAQPPSDITD